MQPIRNLIFVSTLLLGAVLFSGNAPAAAAENRLNWRLKENRVDARIDSLELAQLLENIATATGWQVFIEPDTRHTVSAKFQNLTPGEALQRLLGKINFALLPQSNAPAKLFVYRNNLNDATQLIRPKDPAKPIPSELIVLMKSNSKTNIDGLARRLGAKITGRADALNAYRLLFGDDAAAQAARELLGKEDGVAGVDSNFIVPRPTNPEMLEASSALPLNLNPSVSTDGSKVIVGLIDTPVQKLGTSLDGFLLPSLSVAGEAKPSEALPTHGTSMWETILRGVSALPQSGGVPVQILPVDVYGGEASTTTFDVARGIYLAIQNGATIINLSLGSQGDSSFLETLIQTSSKNGVLFFAAAGNQPTAAPTFPAADPVVVAVTAGDSKGNIASYANHGDFVDIVAPGTSVVTFNGQSWLVTGTSASTAYASGFAAALAAASGRPLKEVEAAIRQALPQPKK